eukprot:9466446-Pyramimonas_sp.AAC.1
MASENMVKAVETTAKTINIFVSSLSDAAWSLVASSRQRVSNPVALLSDPAVIKVFGVWADREFAKKMGSTAQALGIWIRAAFTKIAKNFLAAALDSGGSLAEFAIALGEVTVHGPVAPTWANTFTKQLAAWSPIRLSATHGLQDSRGQGPGPRGLGARGILHALGLLNSASGLQGPSGGSRILDS